MLCRATLAVKEALQRVFVVFFCFCFLNYRGPLLCWCFRCFHASLTLKAVTPFSLRVKPTAIFTPCSPRRTNAKSLRTTATTLSAPSSRPIQKFLAAMLPTTTKTRSSCHRGAHPRSKLAKIPTSAGLLLFGSSHTTQVPLVLRSRGGIAAALLVKCA